MRLIRDFGKRWWRLWSLQLSFISTTLMAFIWASPDTVVTILIMVPGWLRVTIVVGGFAIISAARLLRQSPKEAKNATHEPG